MYRLFIFFCAVTASANQLGYIYQPLGQSIEIGGPLSIGGTSYAGSTASLGYGYGSVAGGGSTTFPDTGLGRFAGAYESNGKHYKNNNNQNGYNNNDRTATRTNSNSLEYNKEFYSYAAPEEQINEIFDERKFANSLKKNLRVLFIKAPENEGFAKATLQLAQQAAAQQTVIYVLSKQTDIGDLANKLQTLRTESLNRPEVHFVKYRTPEESVRAQQTIQSQYDALGGTSHSSKEEVAPVLDFASADGKPSIDPRTAVLEEHRESGRKSSLAVASNKPNFATTRKKDYLPPRL